MSKALGLYYSLNYSLWDLLPIIITLYTFNVTLVYSHLHVDCKSFGNYFTKDSRKNLYIEAINDDAPIMIAHSYGKLLYHEFDKTNVSSFTTSFSCYVRTNCLGPESIQRRVIQN
jgi:hypothetical protein